MDKEIPIDMPPVQFLRIVFPRGGGPQVDDEAVRPRTRTRVDSLFSTEEVAYRVPGLWGEGADVESGVPGHVDPFCEPGGRVGWGVPEAGPQV